MNKNKFLFTVASSFLLLGGLTSCGAKHTMKREDFIKDDKLDYLYDVTYNDYSWDDVTDWMNSKKNVNSNQGGFGCSSIHYDNFYGRSFDFCFTKMNEFLVKTKNENGHFASVGISIADCNLTDDRMQKIIAGTGDEKDKTIEKLIPFGTVDGINENGVVCNTNVVPAHDLDPLEGQTEYHTTGTNPGKPDLFYQFMPRFILDNATSAKHAVQLLKERNLTAVNKKGEVCDLFGVAKMGYELHCMIADKDETYVIEMVDNQMIVLKSGSHVMTNYYLSNMSATGQGFERYAILFDHWQDWNNPNEGEDCSLDAMKVAIHDVMYSEAYNPALHPKDVKNCPKWPTEFAGSGVPFYKAQEECQKRWDEGTLEPALRKNYDRVKDPKTGERYEPTDKNIPWISTHAEVFDIENRTLHLVTQEAEVNDQYDFKEFKL
ncbi:MAG: linear amide C-N hydrolase [Bacilli bacterium]|nr:linear amide C-N hydrolase [Bacilli bacterium]